MDEKVKVIVWGLGAMGSGIARMLLGKEGFEIVGAIDADPEKSGKRLFEILDVAPNDANGVVVESDPREVVTRGAADVVLLATRSVVSDVFPSIELAVTNNINVITTAEEMIYPRVADPTLSDRIHELARKHEVAVLGTGINPGFIMDYLVICLTGVCDSIDKIKVVRRNDFSPFGVLSQIDQGVGLSPDEFKVKAEDGTVPGHVGYPQAFGMFEEAFNVRFDRTVRKIAPVIAEKPRVTEYLSSQSGEVAGTDTYAYAEKDGKVFVELSHPQQIRPDAENIPTGDYIDIDGNPKISLKIEPEIEGGIGTIAACVNMIPHILNSTPGLKTMLDMPCPRAIMTDVRELIGRASGQAPQS
ncbi:MAG: 2,4-diaminopentanoate dehydrogenase [Halothiobacillaceae bacterium]